MSDETTEAKPELADGIYFSLPEAEYHALERLSNSGICNMLKSPADFWKTSWLNPDREDVDTDTPARIIGRLYHTAVFEPHLLNERFVSEVNIEDYEGMLKNATEIEAALDKRGEPKKLAGEKVLDKAIRLRESGYSGAILHLLQDDWEKARGERQGIPSKVWEQLQIDMKHIDNQPDVKEHVIGGFAEVSVLWTDKKTGIKMKCRIDYLKPTTFTDYKTFDNSLGKYVEQCITDAVQYNRYYVQAYLYRQVVEMIRAGKISEIRDENVKPEHEALIEQIRQQPIPIEPWYVFQQKGVSNVMARRIEILGRPHASHANNQAGVSHETTQAMAQKTRRLTNLGRKAKLEVQTMLGMFNWYMEITPKGQAWGAMKPSGVIDDDCFSPYWLTPDEK